MNRACFPKKKTPEFTKMGEIHELCVLALSLVWFAGATPEISMQMVVPVVLFTGAGPRCISTSGGKKKQVSEESVAIRVDLQPQRRSKHAGFGEYGFEHRAQRSFFCGPHRAL